MTHITRTIRYYLVAFIAIATLCISCDELDFRGLMVPTSDDVEKRFSQSIAYNHSVQLPSEIPYIDDGPIRRFNVEGSEYRLYMASDLHVSTHTDHIDNLLRTSALDPLSIATVYAGDLVQGKDSWETLWYNTQFNQEHYGPEAKEKPVLATVGNHDLFFNQWEKYREYYKTATWYAEIDTHQDGVARRDVLIALDTASGILGKKQLAWLDALLYRINAARQAGSLYHRIIITTHTNLVANTKSETIPLTEQYELLGMFSRYHVDIVIMGHDHRHSDLTFGGVHYYVMYPIKQDGNDHPSTISYLRLDVSPSDITPKLIFCK